MNEERCAICGDVFTDEDIKIYCPDCGLPMHKDCFDMAGQCPNSAMHYRYEKKDTPAQPVSSNRHFSDGSGCEICGKPFSETDEKVFCPDCGASMHRICYGLTHNCPYADEHERKSSQNVISKGKAVNFNICGKCGSDLDNGEDKVYCPICGTPVHRSCWDKDPVCPNSDRHDSGFDWDKEQEKLKKQDEPPKNIYTAPAGTERRYGSFSDLIKDNPIRYEEDGEEMTCNGVKQQELVHFLGINNIMTPRFFTIFMNMANNGKIISLNISAWFFMPLYQFYRRMTGPAVILTLLTFILTVPTFIGQLMLLNGSQVTETIPFADLITVTSYILIAVRLILLLFNDYLYMRWSVSKILSLRERYKDLSPDEYYAVLEQKGNPKFLYVLGGLSLVFLLVYALNVFLNLSGMLT